MSPQNNSATPDIAQRVQFWEEQDKINQVLIPRVLKHHELLSKHIQEHASLPTYVTQAAQTATQGVQDSFKSTVNRALVQHNKTIKELEADHQSNLLQLRQTYDAAADKARQDFNQAVNRLESRHAAELSKVRAQFAEDQKKQTAAFSQATAELKARHQADLALQKEEYATARAQDRKARNIFIALTILAAASGITGLAYNLLV